MKKGKCAKGSKMTPKVGMNAANPKTGNGKKK